MKIVIVEDEILVAKGLAKLLQQLRPDLSILAQLNSLAQARAWFSQNPEPDLLFLDIQLSDGVSFELFEQFKIQCGIIFTTAYNEYALRAFKVNSIDYLLKPINKTELEYALNKWENWQQKSSLNLQTQLEALLKNFNNPSTETHYKARFLVTTKQGIMPVEVQDIACFQKQEIIFIHTYQGQTYIAEHNTLEDIDELLHPQHFFRANRQYILHHQNIARIKQTHKGAQVILKYPKNTAIDISREKVSAFKNWLGG